MYNIINNRWECEYICEVNFMREWFYSKDGQQVGPISQEKLVEFIKTNMLSPETYIWTEGMPEWGLISQSPFAKLINSKKQPIGNSSTNVGKTNDNKSDISTNVNIGSAQTKVVGDVKHKAGLVKKAEDKRPAKRDMGGFMEDSEDRKRKVPKAYVHSGKYPPNAIFLVPLISILPLFILAPIYAAGILYIPFIYLNFILIGGYGFACGFIVQAVGKIFKVRHTQLQFIFAALVGVCAICLSWFFWVKFLLGSFIFSPITMMQVMSIIAEKGTWGLGKGATVSGILLYLFWIVEAVSIIVMSIIAANINSPFCERCDEWIETSDKFSPLAVCSNSPLLVKNVMSGNFDTLKSLGRQKANSGHYTTVTLTSCLKCGKMHVLSVVDVVETPKKDGEGVDTTEKDILENILIDYEDYKLLKNNWK